MAAPQAVPLAAQVLCRAALGAEALAASTGGTDCGSYKTAASEGGSAVVAPGSSPASGRSSLELLGVNSKTDVVGLDGEVEDDEADYKSDLGLCPSAWSTISLPAGEGSAGATRTSSGGMPEGEGLMGAGGEQLLRAAYAQQPMGSPVAASAEDAALLDRIRRMLGEVPGDAGDTSGGAGAVAVEGSAAALAAEDAGISSGSSQGANPQQQQWSGDLDAFLRQPASISVDAAAVAAAQLQQVGYCR